MNKSSAKSGRESDDSYYASESGVNNKREVSDEENEFLRFSGNDIRSSTLLYEGGPSESIVEPINQSQVPARAASKIEEVEIMNPNSLESLFID